MARGIHPGAAAALVALAAAGLAAPPQDRPGTEARLVPVSYRLSLDGRAMTIHLDRPETIACGGRSHVVVVSCPAVQRFEGHGIAFDYPRTATVSERTDTAWAHLTVEFVEGPTVTLEVRETAGGPAEGLSKLLDAEKAEWLDAWKPAGIQGSRESAAVRDLAGRREGIRVEASLTGGREVAEIYAIPGARRTVVATFGWGAAEAKEAKPLLDALAASLRLVD
ncbi:MAG: hypothetical protein L0216_07965 [Planctomycetales bacterium]|nr:hypothetical protein [Planctomycetales bacterium]